MLMLNIVSVVLFVGSLFLLKKAKTSYEDIKNIQIKLAYLERDVERQDELSKSMSATIMQVNETVKAVISKHFEFERSVSEFATLVTDFMQQSSKEIVSSSGDKLLDKIGKRKLN